MPGENYEETILDLRIRERLGYPIVFTAVTATNTLLIIGTNIGLLLGLGWLVRNGNVDPVSYGMPALCVLAAEFVRLSVFRNFRPKKERPGDLLMWKYCFVLGMGCYFWWNMEVDVDYLYPILIGVCGAFTLTIWQVISEFRWWYGWRLFRWK